MSEQTDSGLAPLIMVDRVEELPAALERAGLAPERAVVMLVGGAGGMGEQDVQSVSNILRDTVVPVVERHAAVVVGGGTDSGVMHLIGRARSAARARFPLVGVAATGTVAIPGGSGPTSSDAAPLEPHHTLYVLVPGREWGDEAPWMSYILSVVAGSRPSVG
jgi:hypothetical protein